MILDLIRKEKQSYADVAMIYGKNKASIHEILKKEKEIHATFAVAPHGKVMATVCAKLRWKSLYICTIRYF